jgi:hypothetical protein
VARGKLLLDLSASGRDMVDGVHQLQTSGLPDRPVEGDCHPRPTFRFGILSELVPRIEGSARYPLLYVNGQLSDVKRMYQDGL